MGPIPYGGGGGGGGGGRGGGRAWCIYIIYTYVLLCFLMRPSLFGMTIAHPSYQIPPNPHGLVEATNEVGLEFLSIVVGIR